MYRVYVTNFVGDEEMIYECERAEELDNGYADYLDQLGFYFRVEYIDRRTYVRC